MGFIQIIMKSHFLKSFFYVRWDQSHHNFKIEDIYFHFLNFEIVHPVHHIGKLVSWTLVCTTYAQIASVILGFKIFWRVLFFSSLQIMRCSKCCIFPKKYVNSRQLYKPYKPILPPQLTFFKSLWLEKLSKSWNFPCETILTMPP